MINCTCIANVSKISIAIPTVRTLLDHGLCLNSTLMHSLPYNLQQSAMLSLLLHSKMVHYKYGLILQDSVHKAKENSLKLAQQNVEKTRVNWKSKLSTKVIFF